MASAQDATQRENSQQHERYDFGAGRIARVALFLVLAVVLICAVLRFVTGPPRSAQRNAAWVEDARRDPALQTAPLDDLARYRSAQRAQLESYGWVDRDAGVVHIPVQRAMEIAAARRHASVRQR